MTTTDPALDDERRLLADTARRYLAERYDFATRARRVAAGTVDPETWRAFGDMGWLGLPLPESCGGLGGSPAMLGALMEAFGRALVVEPYVACVVEAGGLLADAGRHAALAQVVSGATRVTLATLEPDAPPELTDLATRATRGAAGRWHIHGAKHFVADGDAADAVVVPASTADGVAFFLVPVRAPGVAAAGYRTIDGARAADLVLTDVVVEEADRLPIGPASFDAALDRATAALVSEAVGCMNAAYELTVEYAKTRVQFGQPIARFQVVRHRIADMFMALEESRAMAAEALAALSLEDASARARTVSAAKVHVVDCGRFVCQQAIQLHGAIGLTEEYVVGHYYKRIEAIAVSAGDVDWHLDRYMRLGALTEERAG